MHQLSGIYRDGPLIQDALDAARQQAERERPALKERRQAITAEITRTEHSTTRYFDAFDEGRLSPERCEQRLANLTTRLGDLRAQQAELANNDDETAATPTTADLAALAHQLETVLAQGEPERTKALLRILIAELRVNSKAEIQPTYRIVAPGVCATSEKVETTVEIWFRTSVFGGPAADLQPVCTRRAHTEGPQCTLNAHSTGGGGVKLRTLPAAPGTGPPKRAYPLPVDL